MTVDLGDDELVVTVLDDGRGMSGTGRRSGLANLRQRAESVGGSMDVRTAPGGGTLLRWAVPVGAAR